jgi:hypothetical protein
MHRNSGYRSGPPEIHVPRVIDDELDHLTNDLELSLQEQRDQVKTLLKGDGMNV